MCVYVTPPELQDAESGEEENKLRLDLIANLGKIEPDAAQVSDADLGPGASLPAFLIEYAWMTSAAAVAAIFAMAKLERDLDDAIAFARRLYRFVKRLRTIGYDPVLTFEGVCSIALHEIHERNWAEDGIRIDHIVVSNGYTGHNTAYGSLKELEESESEKEFTKELDPLAATTKYTFFGSSGGRLFVVTVDNNGEVLVACRIW